MALMEGGVFRTFGLGSRAEHALSSWVNIWMALGSGVILFHIYNWVVKFFGEHETYVR